MTFPVNFKGVLYHKTCNGVQCCISLDRGMTTLTCPSMRCENCDFFRSQVLMVFFYMSYLYLNKLMGYVDLLDFYENWPNIHQIWMHKNVWCYDEIGNISLVTSQSLITTKIFPIVQLRSLTHFVSLLSADWSCPIYFRVHSNMEAGNSVKKHYQCWV